MKPLFFRLTLALLVCLPTAFVNASPKLVGLAEFSELRRPYYVAALYTDETVNIEQADTMLATQGARKMEMRITANSVSTRRFNVQWAQSFFINNSQDQLLMFNDSLDKFQTMLDAPFVKGDSITIETDEAGIATVAINGITSFTAEKPGFLELLLAKWIGNKPPNSSFKAALLANSVNQEELSYFESLQPTEQRIETVKMRLAANFETLAAL